MRFGCEEESENMTEDAIPDDVISDNHVASDDDNSGQPESAPKPEPRIF